MAVAKGVVLFSVVMFTSFSKGTGVAVNMTCPSRLVAEEVNSVTCTIDTAEILNAGCFSSPTNVLFQIEGQPNSLCTTLYTSGCSATPDSIAEGGCECTEQSGNLRIYLFKFKGTAEEYNASKLECKVCAAIPEITIPPTNCDSLKYADNCPSCAGKCVRSSDDLRTPSCSDNCDLTTPIVLTVLAFMASIIPIALAIYLYIQKEFPQIGPCGEKGFSILASVMAVVALICIAVATYFSCQNFPNDEECTNLCIVDIALTVIGVIAVGITNPLFPIVASCASAWLVAVIIYLHRKCTKEPPPSPRPSPRPRVTITSKRSGQKQTSYKLMWTVPYTDNADIEQFSVEYVQVEADTSSELWKATRRIGEVIEKDVDGKDRSYKIPQLSADTFYEVKIVVSGDTSDGSRFVFKTAA